MALASKTIDVSIHSLIQQFAMAILAFCLLEHFQSVLSYLHDRIYFNFFFCRCNNYNDGAIFGRFSRFAVPQSWCHWSRLQMEKEWFCRGKSIQLYLTDFIREHHRCRMVHLWEWSLYLKNTTEFCTKCCLSNLRMFDCFTHSHHFIPFLFPLFMKLLRRIQLANGLDISGSCLGLKTFRC